MAVVGISQTAMADTIDYWHVYYNQIKIREFNQYGTHEIVLKVDSIKSADSIVVKYFRDTPCPECTTYLAVENEKHQVLLTSQGQGTFNPISIALNKLLKLWEQGSRQNFEIFYFEGNGKRSSGKVLLFRIKLE